MPDNSMEPREVSVSVSVSVPVSVSSASAPQRPSSPFTLSPNVQPSDPSQLIDQVINPLT